VDEEIRRRTAEARDALSKETAELTARLTKELLDKELTGEIGDGSRPEPVGDSLVEVGN